MAEPRDYVGGGGGSSVPPSIDINPGSYREREDVEHLAQRQVANIHEPRPIEMIDRYGKALVMKQYEHGKPPLGIPGEITDETGRMHYINELGQEYSIVPPSSEHQIGIPKKNKRWQEQTPSREMAIKNKFKYGGSVDDFSLMDYMMPAMDKRLGPSLKKFQYGGGVTPDPNDPKYTSYMTSFANAPTGTTDPSAQSMLAQSSGSMSTGIESIFQEAGYQTPGKDYLETISAYDPTKQRRLQEDYSMKMPGPMGGAGNFAGSGARIREAGEQRELVMGQYQRGAEDLRKKYREDVMSQIAEDLASDTYDFEELSSYGG